MGLILTTLLGVDVSIDTLGTLAAANLASATVGQFDVAGASVTFPRLTDLDGSSAFVSVRGTLAFPALTGRVVDDAGILDPATKAALERKLADFESKTTGQLVVVTLKSLQGTSIEDYGYQLGRHWQIGQKDKNTGALLIVAPNERKVRIEVGYGFEGTLTDLYMPKR